METQAGADADGDYTEPEIAARNAAARQASGAVRERGNTTAQRATTDINQFIWYGQSEWQGWQCAPALTLAQPHDCLMLGQSPRPQAVAGNVAGVGRYQPVVDSDFHTLVSVSQNIKTGAIIAPNRGGYRAVSGAVFSTSPTSIGFADGATGVELLETGGEITSRAVGGKDQPPFDLTRVLAPGMQIALRGLVGPWAWIQNNHYVVRNVTPMSLTLGGLLADGVPATAPGGLDIYLINSSVDVLGEESGVGALTFMRKLQLEYRGVEAAADGHRPLLSNACIGGVSIATLSKGAKAALYDRVTDAAARVRDAAKALGKTSVVPVVTFGQGGTDCARGTSYQAYHDATVALVADLRADLLAITGQSRPPLFLTFQISGPNLSDTNDCAIAMAQLDLALQPPNPDWFMIGPFYFVPDQPVPYNGVHWTPNGERWAGQLTGKVLHKILELGEGWLPLHPTRITYRGRHVLIDFHVPEPPLRFQMACVGMKQKMFDDYGFTVTDAGGINEIRAGAIVADQVVKITCARPLASPVIVQYADASRHRGTGNLCDSDAMVAAESYRYTPFNGQLPGEEIATLVDRPYPLWNWCVVFRKVALPG